MSLWIFVTFALFFQEPATTDAALFQVRQNSLSLITVHAIYLIATAIDIALGYKLGQLLQNKFQNSKFESVSRGWADKLERLIGRSGEKFALILLGVINFPYLNAFLASWLKLPFKNIFTLIFIGDAIWYTVEWAINLGIRSIVPDPHLALYIIIGIALLLSLFYKTLLAKILK